MAQNVNEPLVGKESDPTTICVDKARIRQFAKSVGLTDPIHFDEAEAKKQGYASIVAPPTLPIALGQDAEPGGGSGPKVQWNVATLLHEGTELQFERPIVAGDVLTSRSQLKSITRREGKSGARVIYTIETNYTDADGKRVCAMLMRTSEKE